jgi:uncharacterized membrane protein
MTKNEFLSRLADELRKKHIVDAEDIVDEYQQHFAFKMADGFSEEEIAAKLGNPSALAAQFEDDGGEKRHTGKKIVTLIGLCFSDFFVGCFFILLFAWEVVMAAFSMSNAVVAVCLFGGMSPWSLIPPLPYWCGAVFGLSFAALSVFSAVGCVYFAAFIRQLMRSYGRFHKNTLAAASGGAVLPSLAVFPRLSAKANRRFRTVALGSLTLFAVFLVLGTILSMLFAGALEFWHVWGWFGYAAT